MPPRRQRPRRTVFAITLAGLVAAIVPVVPAMAADPVEVVFASTGAEQSWTVPDGVTSVHVVAIGAPGGTASSIAVTNPPSGGMGARVVGDLAVTPGSTLYIEVGGPGGTALPSGGSRGGPGGFNGGGVGGPPGVSTGAGGGGGASDIRTTPRADTGSLASRLLVAAGGGGGGTEAGATGGAAGSGGSNASLATGGGAGTASAGGAGGIAAGGITDGVAGSQGTGGAGAGTSGTPGGGGGAGGYYGGGGGGVGAGGGGGSSFTGAASNASVQVATTATPSITITYQVGPGATPDPTTAPDSGVVDATISMTSSVCIELSTVSVDFGSGRFGQVGVAGSPDIAVTNCGAVPVALLARGTDATAPGAVWNLDAGTAQCTDTLGLDAYHLSLQDAETLDDTWGLGTTNTLLGSVAVGSASSYAPLIDTACPGSSGAGQVMSMQIIFTATESQP